MGGCVLEIIDKVQFNLSALYDFVGCVLEITTKHNNFVGAMIEIIN